MSVLSRVGRWPRRLVSALREPSIQTDLMQIAKTTLAVVVAWVVASDVLGLAQAFLAPWMAMLTVQATVYRSLTTGMQTVLASVTGLVLAVLAAQLLGAGPVSLAVAVLVGLLLSRSRLVRPEGILIATTGLLVITTGAENEPWVLLDRIYDTLIGVGIGVVVNLVVVPPLNDRSAERQLDRLDENMGGLLRDIAGQMRARWGHEDADTWVDRTRELDDDLARAWQLARHAQESGWWNPRTYLSRSRPDRTAYERLLERLEEGIAQIRTMARTVRESRIPVEEWDAVFRERWVDILGESGRRIEDPDANVRGLHDDLEELASDLSREELPGLIWPTYGALITDLLNLVDIVDDVATSRPART